MLFFWHEHIQRFAGDDAQHSEPFWYYLPLMVAFTLPWMALLPSTVKQAWLEKRNSKVAFLLLWLLMTLAFFSLAKVAQQCSGRLQLLEVVDDELVGGLVINHRVRQRGRHQRHQQPAAHHRCGPHVQRPRRRIGLVMAPAAS